MKPKLNIEAILKDVEMCFDSSTHTRIITYGTYSVEYGDVLQKMYPKRDIYHMYTHDPISDIKDDKLNMMINCDKYTLGE